MKQFITGTFIFLILSVPSIWAIFYFSEPFEESQTFWLPENHSIINKVGSGYLPVEGFQTSGTAIWISLENYKELFSSADGNVAIEKE